jgi:TonB-linked SusC/RagA family outer membrane protein
MKNMLTFMVAILMSCHLLAQNTITGTVIDGSDNSPMIGASVLVKGTSVGVITDINGAFSIKVPAGKNTLVFSSVGYKSQEINISGKKSIKVILQQDTKVLDEVVVVGYGTMKKSDLSGSTATMSEDKIKGSVITNLDQSFQGRVSGVTSVATSGAPGSSSSIRVRGQATINAGAEPLYVIDGVIVQGGGSSGSSVGLGDALGNGSVSSISPLSTINPSDILSMEILKDASATAIYGAQGANGVVLITTKHGKAGEAKFSYDGMMAWQRQTKRIDMMNLREFAEYYNSFVNVGMATQRDDFSDPSTLGKGTNWQDAIFRTAFEHSHQLSAQGGNDKVKYYVSGGYMNQDGTLIGSNFGRYSFRTNLDAQLKKWMKIGVNATFTNTNERLLKADQDEGIISYALTTTPDIPIYDLDGSYTSVVREGAINPNPIALALDKDIRLKRNVLEGSIFVEVTPIKNLVWHSELGYNYGWSRASVFIPTEDLGKWQVTINSASAQKNTNNFWQFKNYLTYTGNIKKHSFTAMLGQECWESKYDYASVSNTNLPSNNIHNPSLGTGTPSINSGYGTSTMASFFTRETYNYDDRYLLTYTFRRDGSSNFGPNNRWGSFHSFAASWRFTNEKFFDPIKKILNNGKLRVGWGQTGNSNIGSYKWGASMSKMETGLGVGYRQSNIANSSIKWEKQVQWNLGVDLGFLNDMFNLVIDVYKKTSSDMLMPLQLPSYLGTSGNSSSMLTAPWGNYGKITNKGLEITLNAHPIHSKEFSWDSDFEISWNKNKLIALKGTASASILGKGMWNDVVSKSDVGHSLYNFYGYVCDGVYKDLADLQLSPKPTAYPSNGKFNRSNTVWVGDIKFKDLNHDGVIDENDRTYIGSPMPKYTFGWTNTFRYKNFDLSVFVNGSVGNKVFNYLNRSLSHMNTPWNNQVKDVNNYAVLSAIDANKSYTSGWTGNNNVTAWNWYNDVDNVQVTKSGSLPRPVIGDPNENNRISDRYIEDGSYLRIKNITFGYNFPKKVLNHFRIEALRLYANIQNLCTITGYNGYDPEVGASTADSNGYVYGLDNGRYPSPTVYSFGLNVTF